MASFELGMAVIPFEAGDGYITQTYEPKLEGTVLLLGSGSSIKQSLDGALDKIKTVISANGVWTPPSLSGLQYSGPLMLKCAAPRSIHDPDTQITVTAKRRSDPGYTPRGYGIVEGRMVETGVNMVGNEAQLTPITNATSYLLTYWPYINVFATLRENMNAASSTFGWTLTCEEV